MGVVLVVLVVGGVAGFLVWKKRNPTAADAAVQNLKDKVTGLFHKK